MKNTAVIAVALAMGFIGGASSTLLLPAKTARAQASQPTAKTRLIKAEIVQAKHFVLVDAAGQVRGFLGMTGGQPEFRLIDDNRQTRAIISVADGTGMSISNPNEAGSIQLNVSKDGQPSMRMLDKAGNMVWHCPTMRTLPPPTAPEYPTRPPAAPTDNARANPSQGQAI